MSSCQTRSGCSPISRSACSRTVLVTDCASVVPVPVVLGVQVGGPLREQVQRGPEVAYRVAGHGGPQPDPLQADALVRGS